MDDRLKILFERREELERLLQDPTVIRDQRRYGELSREHRRLTEALAVAEEVERLEASRTELEKTMRGEQDGELRAMGEEELKDVSEKIAWRRADLEARLRPRDPLDAKDIIVEIRAGVGGEEAALFAAELFRMYGRFAERRGWETALLSTNRTGIGGFKEVIFEVRGQDVYSTLKEESGVHRVQRVPATEKSGRVHTSTATVAVLPEADEVDVVIRPEDLNIDVSTARGHGGQSVNTTYSAVRLTHVPTGIIISCQDERSQKQNREKALKILRARLLAIGQEKAQSAMASERRRQVGTAERSEKIRTYNVPQDRVTDHRLKESFHGLSAILDGELDSILMALNKTKEASR